MNILMVSAEWAPFAKVGGLADMATALADALGARGHDVRVVLPLYGQLDRHELRIRPLTETPWLPLRVGQHVHQVRFYRRSGSATGVQIYFVENGHYFGRGGIYVGQDGHAFSDTLSRLSLHGQAALALPRLLDWPVDVLHCHDVHAATAAVYRQRWYRGSELPGPAGVLLTIHNLTHQEIHGPGGVDMLGLPAVLAAYPGVLEFHGNINLLKAGILDADLVNTVSPTYAREVVGDPRIGSGLEGVLKSKGRAFSGILNGADYRTWDPRDDQLLVQRYGPDSLDDKKACGADLRRELALAADHPIAGMVGRLVTQKGLELVLPALRSLVAAGWNFAVLGSGEARIETALRAAVGRQRGRVAFVRAFDEALAHRIYAGADVFLMPSLFEPCGLAQMYALRYGTPPVVRATGGLADSVVDVSEPDGTGFVFHAATPKALIKAMVRARRMWADTAAWRKLQRRGMACEFSWDVAAASYEELYRRLAVTRAEDSAAAAAEER